MELIILTYEFESKSLETSLGFFTISGRKLFELTTGTIPKDIASLRALECPSRGSFEGNK